MKIISHRLALTRDADLIIVLEKGKIVEEGTHEGLLEKNGLYSKMYRAQSDLYQIKR